MKTKRILTAILTLCLCICLFTVTVSAAQVASGSLGTNLTWKLDDEGTLTISGKGAMVSLRSQRKPWHDYADDIVTVVIKSGVTNIGSGAFDTLRNLEKVTMASSVTSIDYCAFNCSLNTKLHEITIGSGVKTIGNLAFATADITSLTIPDNVETIGESAFGGCNKLTKLTIGDGVKTIEKKAFSSCKNLVSVKFGKKVETIGELAFTDCGLRSVELPDSVKYIGNNAFNNCRNLVTVDLGNGVESIGSYAFYWCDALKTIEIPDSVTELGNSVFERCEGAAEIVIGDKLQNIPAKAFNGCKSATSVTFGKKVTSIGNGAFANTGLIDVTIPAGITSIGESAFSSSDLVSVTVNSSCDIPQWAFGYCSKLQNVKLNNEIKYIGESAFSNCTSLVEIVLPDALAYLAPKTFYDCRALERAILSDEVAYIGGYAFSGCNKFKFLAVPDSVTSVGTYAMSASDSTAYFCGDMPVLANRAMGYVSEQSGYWPAGNDTWSLDYLSQEMRNMNWSTFELPDAPAVTSGNDEDGYVKLEWSSVDGSVRYLVYRATSKNGSYKKIGYTTASDYTDTTGTTGKTYYYKIRVITGNGIFTEYSTPVKGVNLCMKATKVSAANVTSSGKIKLSWEKIDGATQYVVYRATSKNGTYKKLTTTSKTSVTNTSAVVGKTYYYYVVALGDNDVKSVKSNIVSRTCDLAQPSISVSNRTSDGAVTIKWAEIDDAVKYEVYRATSKSGTYKKLTTTSKTSYNDTTGTAGKTYYYKVRAICDNDSAASAYSAIKSRTYDLAQPSVSITTSSGKPKVSWKKVDGAKEYKVYRATSKSGTYSKVKTTTSLNWKDTSAKKGKTYYYKVVAVCKNTSGNSAYSAVKSIKATK